MMTSLVEVSKDKGATTKVGNAFGESVCVTGIKADSSKTQGRALQRRCEDGDKADLLVNRDTFVIHAQNGKKRRETSSRTKNAKRHQHHSQAHWKTKKP